MGNVKQAIAIIGMGCRYPGASDTDALWRLLKNGEIAIGEVPADRFGALDRWYDSRPSTPGRMMSRFGGFLEGIDRFDADFFGIAPLEARQLDPQQRVLLEVAWEAIEDAGIPAGRLCGTSAGVFIGSWTQDFEARLIGDPVADDLRNIDLYSTTGSGRYALAGRLSYFFDLQGPSMVVDTACSSSLLAIHLACRSLMQKECDIALAGGVNIMLTPYISVAYSQARMMAPDGRCKFGDARADGYVRSEGCGMVVLKPLARALADGDAIYAVILGGAVNNDGRASGNLTTPGVRTQEELLRKAYADAGIDPAQVHYVEAHGTGTRAGDPVELSALGAVLSEGRAMNRPCLVGSIKTNLGHTEGAAGVAGLIKVALAIKHREIPASLNLINPNPNIAWEKLALKIPTQTMPWPSEHGPLVAGVNAFGITGTNTHLVLSEAPARRVAANEQRPALGGMANKWLFPLSAHSREALRAMAQRVHAHIASASTPPSLDDLCATAAFKREHHEYRMAVVAGDRERLLEELAAFGQGGAASGTVYSAERINTMGKLAFVYPGQGSQWIGMGRDLMRHSAVFREAIERCEKALAVYVDWSLREQLEASGADSRLDDISVVQPVLFALQVALTAQWRAWGVMPDAVIGHSMGEPAAAHAAGVLDLDAAARIIVARSRLMKRTSGHGAMAVVELTMEQAAAEIKGLEAALSIAVSNSPRSTVLSGDPAALEKLLGDLERRQIFCRKINVDVASHSPQMEPLREELVAGLDGLVPHASTVPIYSTVAGGLLEGSAFEAAYWGDNLRQPVRFEQSIGHMLADGHTIFIEMSPHPVLLRAIDECIQAHKAGGGPPFATLPSLLRKEDEPATLLESLGRLYVLGHPLDWHGLYGELAGRVPFPTYPWQRERHWFEEPSGRSRTRRHAGGGREGQAYHALLERHISSSLHVDLHLWESELHIDRLPWLSDHTVQGHPVFPAAAFLDSAVAAAEEALGGAVQLRDLAFSEALFPDRKAGKQMQVVISRSSGGGWEIRTLSRPANAPAAGRSWREHMHGTVVAQAGRREAPQVDVEAVRTRCAKVVTGDQHYADMQRLKIGYGPAFRNIERIARGKTEAIARVRVPQAIAAEARDYRIHPAVLDTGLQLLVSMAAGEDAPSSSNATWLPVHLETARIFAPLPATEQLWAVCMAGEHPDGADDRFTGDLLLIDQAGQTLFEARRVELRRIGYTLGEDVDQWLYMMAWQPRPLIATDGGIRSFLPAPTEIERRAAATPLPSHLRSDAETAGQVLPLIERLSLDYILAALTKLGMQFEVDRSFTVEDLARRLHIGDRHRKLLDRMLFFLQEEGILKHADNVWRIARQIDTIFSQESEERLLSQYPQCRVELALLKRCGQGLAEALSGDVEPLELLFPDGSLEEAETFYGDSVFARTANHHAVTAIAAAIADLPAGQTLRILEIGAGTGGLTRRLIDRLPAGRVRYRFTDIGAAFVTRAQEKYRDLAGMEYGVLDIEKDPAAQGIEPHSFDIVVAANCLHATRDMHVTLTNVRRMLAPAGLMLLIEGTRHCRWVDLIFGLTEGWWRFEDFQHRLSHPLLDAAAWKRLAAGSGFEDAVVFRGPEAALYEQSIVVARAAAEVASTVASPDQKKEANAWLIFSDRGGLGETLGQALRDQGHRCHLVARAGHGVADAGDLLPDDPAYYERALRQLDSEAEAGRRSVVFMWALDETDHAPQSVDALRDSQESLCGGLLLLVRAMVGRENDRRTRLWVVSRRALPTGLEGTDLSLTATTLGGLVKVIDLEHPELGCRAVDLDGDAGDQISNLLDELAAGDGEAMTAYRDGLRIVPRMVSMDARSHVDGEWLTMPGDSPSRLVNENRGTLDGLKMRPAPYTPPGPGEVAIQVRAAGLNFRDVVCALGLIPDNDDPGLECAGRIVAVGAGVTGLSPGDDVIAAAPGAFATIVHANAAMTAVKPDGLTYEQAATIPIAFLTAYHALIGLADLKAGERVLIHAASGGVGLAAVQIAKARGAMIYGTAGTPRKRDFLSSIGVDHVFDSRSLDFAARIGAETGGEGVDVVLNSLSGEFIERSFEVLRRGGRFVEIGKRDIWSPEKARQLRPDAFYAFFDLAGMIAGEPERVRPMFDLLLKKFSSGELKPLPAMIWPMEQIVRAYRTMQQAGHMGKIVVNVPPWSGARAIDAPDAFRADATYLITGAFGGIGLRLVQWLFDRGARYFALSGRSVPKAAVAARIADLEAAGAHVRVAVCDVASDGHVERLVSRDLAQMPPLRGVFHLAGALDDGALIQQSWARFETVFAPKVLGAWNLHRHTQHLNLDCFVLFSSWASFLGSQGQANHSAANAFLDALAWRRRAAGQPGLSINWGAWAEIGAATKGDAAEHLARRGIGSFSPEMGFRALGRLMSQGGAQAAVTPFELRRWRKASAAAEKSTWFEFIDAASITDADDGKETVEDAPVLDLKKSLLAAQPGKPRYLIMEAFLKEQVAKTLRLPIARIDANKPFKSFGMDSLTALEFRNRVEAGTEATLSATLVWNYPTIGKLAPFLFEKMSVSIDQERADIDERASDETRSPAPDETNGAKLLDLLDAVEQMSEDEARQLLDGE